jgi:hypothetical protein
VQERGERVPRLVPRKGDKTSENPTWEANDPARREFVPAISSGGGASGESINSWITVCQHMPTEVVPDAL